MQTRDWTKFAARAIVGAATAWVVSKVVGPKAGVVGAVAVVAAHEMFDAPLANYLDRTIRA